MKSVWKAQSANHEFKPLEEDIKVDVAIIGGGITGITTAYLLAEQGKKVAVLESRRIGEGTTGHSTGNLYSMIDKRLHHIQSKWSSETAKKVAQSRTSAISLIEELVNKHDILCDFKRVPWVLFSETNAKDETIEKERKAANDYGLEVSDLESLSLPIKMSSGIKVENQAQFNPAQFVKGLARHINPDNCKIYENTPVREVDYGKNHQLLTPKAKISANHVVMATHIPKGFYPVQTAVYPYREYAIAAKLHSDDFPEGIFWDTESKQHHSMRCYKTDEGVYLVLVGLHHKVGHGKEMEHYYDILERNARKYFKIESIDYKWSAQHYKPADGLPYIGETARDRVYMATGFSTDGLTYGVLSAMILTDAIVGKDNPWAEVYKASRFTPLKSAKNFLKENLNVAKEYADVLPGKHDSLDLSDVAPGQGKVLEKDGSKWAVYKSEKGEVQCVSAICTHLKCVVRWNGAEKSWDCPCHGSRFEPDGSVIEGPALKPLKKKDQ